ncbi:Uncharacterised protein [uncultured archaeon]|nr:Uncharacterised protein [uncultured archaeon]
MYYAPSTQVSDAYQKKMLFNAGIVHPFQKVLIENNGSLDFVPEEGLELEFWRFTDCMFQYALENHRVRETREIMRHLCAVYHKAPHASAAVLKKKGFEAEPEVVIPVYPDLIFGTIAPLVEGVDADELSVYYKAWKNPDFQHKLEAEIARRSGLPERHIIVAGVPNLEKLSSEYAPVRIGSEIKSLFELRPEYSRNFSERADRIACLRVAVHPQMYGLARAFFEENSFARIVEEVLK